MVVDCVILSFANPCSKLLRVFLPCSDTAANDILFLQQHKEIVSELVKGRKRGIDHVDFLGLLQRNRCWERF